MRSVYDLRRENLSSLKDQWGGPTSLAKKLGHSNGSYIAQLVGPNPTREISEKVARGIEAKLSMPVGWLDQDRAPSSARLDDTLFAQCVRAVTASIRDAGLSPYPDVYSNLVDLAYEHAKLVKKIDEPFIQKLVRLTK